ncbi:MAG TPA: GAF domain-containing SpoIIE family protein phosphatase [Bryobacteraceae bacterium]|nr:GAF domain-containing SpoIIE family protein phosphatase [Bryobacteraceae bacterium]
MPSLPPPTSADRISRVIFQYASEIAAEADLDHLLELNARLARDITGADRCSIWLVDEHSRELWTKVAQGVGQIRIPLTQGIVGACVAANAPIVINDAASDRRFQNTVDAHSGYVTKSILTLPLRSSEDTAKVIGALQVLNKPDGFSDADANLLGLASSYTASALNLQRLRKEAEEARLLHREIEIARDVQSKLFPQHLPPVARVEYAGFCRPAKFVGGDYYDFLPTPDGSFVFTLGDVSGKGIAAAVLMASIQASLRTQMLRPPGDLVQLIAELNRSVFNSSTPDKYSTLFCGWIDPARRRLRYVNAGQVQPLLVRGKTARQLEVSSMPVGLIEHAIYEQAEVEIQSGDLLIAYSDGVTEAMNPAEELWSDAEVNRICSRYTGTDVIEALVRGVDMFANGAEQSDDLTVIAISIRSL